MYVSNILLINEKLRWSKGFEIFFKDDDCSFSFFWSHAPFPKFFFLTLYHYLMKGIILHVLFSRKLHIFNWEKTNHQCHYINLTQTILSLDSVFQEVCHWIIYQHISIWPLIFFICKALSLLYLSRRSSKVWANLSCLFGWRQQHLR